MSAETWRSLHLSIHRSWIRRIGTGLRKWSFCRLAAGDDETGVFEHAQVLHRAEPGHLQLRLELGERAAVTRKEPVEQEAPRRVGERFEDPVVVGHVSNTIRDQIVTCQASGPGFGRPIQGDAPYALLPSSSRSRSGRSPHSGQ